MATFKTDDEGREAAEKSVAASWFEEGGPARAKAYWDELNSLREVEEAQRYLEAANNRRQVEAANTGNGRAAAALPGLAASEAGAAALMIRDTDAILARLEEGIAREREKIDGLLARVRRPAA